ncbi:hypothetical protein OH76DRAFT_293974 [Lentinus brumalis]|uniref:Uncharacterized protein n=1 Tax=Lentinus brumalis TaxID=2498619 RepID=A0A371DG06_9APHY|nr:hypothetical protein OH76DRAFT_293974 [Polyporus brumalis]
MGAAGVPGSHSHARRTLLALTSSTPLCPPVEAASPPHLGPWRALRVARGSVWAGGSPDESATEDRCAVGSARALDAPRVSSCATFHVCPDADRCSFCRIHTACTRRLLPRVDRAARAGQSQCPCINNAVAAAESPTAIDATPEHGLAAPSARRRCGLWISLRPARSARLVAAADTPRRGTCPRSCGRVRLNGGSFLDDVLSPVRMRFSLGTRRTTCGTRDATAVPAMHILIACLSGFCVLAPSPGLAPRQTKLRTLRNARRSAANMNDINASDITTYKLNAAASIRTSLQQRRIHVSRPGCCAGNLHMLAVH